MAKKSKPNMAQARAAGEPPQSSPVQTGGPTGAPPGGMAAGGSPAESAVNHLQEVVTLWKSNPQEVGPIVGEFVRIVDGMKQAGSPAAPTSAQPAPPQPPGPPAPMQGAAPTLAATRGAMA